MVDPRDKNLNVRVSEREIAMLAELADDSGQTSSDWLRTMIHREHRKMVRRRKAEG